METTRNQSSSSDEENNTLTKKFIKGIAEHNLTKDELVGWKYCGGSGEKRHRKYYKLTFPHAEGFPLSVNNCVCGHHIMENCYITNENKTRILILGNCYIKKFISKSGRTCEVCGESHKNRKSNVCNKCRCVCKECGKNVGSVLEDRLCFKCTLGPKIYITVPYKQKEIVKKSGAHWDQDAKSWYFHGNHNSYKFTEWM